MTTLITILTEGFADWEIALLTGAARSFYGMKVLHAAPGGAPVTSAGGLRVSPDLAIRAIELGAADALIVCGGAIWRTSRAPDLADLLRRAREQGLLIGGICDGTRPLAQAGLLDQVEHTSNSPETLLETGYGGRANYWDVPYAVSVDRIVTAPGTAPVSFMAEILEGLGLGDQNLDYYLGLLAAEHSNRNRPPHAPASAEADISFTGR
ncbi:MAG: DJ-1/PfpI family protein [Devosia sp.]|nr:DJ-1/PfpI family protein [Devosia sp.]